MLGKDYFFTCGPDGCTSKWTRAGEPQERNSAVKKLLGNFLRIIRTDLRFFADIGLSKYIIITLLIIDSSRTPLTLIAVLEVLWQALERLKSGLVHTRLHHTQLWVQWINVISTNTRDTKTVAGSWEHGNGLSGSIKGETFLDWLLKKESSPWS
jgi:hypothetical protein